MVDLFIVYQKIYDLSSEGWNMPLLLFYLIIVVFSLKPVHRLGRFIRELINSKYDKEFFDHLTSALFSVVSDDKK